jgi:transcriptional regulator with XRE-family HTH domain
MQIAGWSQRELSTKSGVSQRQVSNILTGATSCSIETAADLARAFGLTNWHLLMPGLSKDLLTSPSLERLVRAYVEAPQSVRDYLDTIADRELKAPSPKG